ncbi:MAG: hypothetical protein IPN95_11520 [Bacteroidetes bacterium]|nr:hypothetical protein [Bacteroidota bacterium]
MDLPILVVEGLSKQYTISQQGQGSILQDFWQGLKQLFSNRQVDSPIVFGTSRHLF